MCEQVQPEAGRSPSVTSAVTLVKDWLDAVEKADDAAFIRFVQERGPVLRGGPDEWLRLRGMLRGVRLCGVNSAEADNAALWFSCRRWRVSALRSSSSQPRRPISRLCWESG
jgi:hypothetical protein